MASFILTIFLGASVGAEEPVYDATTCVRLLDNYIDYVDQHGRHDLDVNVLTSLLTDQHAVRVLVRIIPLKEFPTFSMQTLGLEPRPGTTIPPNFTLFKKRDLYAVIAGEGQAVVGRLHELSQRYGQQSLGLYLLQSKGPDHGARIKAGEKVLSLSGFTVGDTLASLEDEDPVSVTLYDTDLLTANFAVPTHETRGLSRALLARIGIQQVQKFDRKSFAENSVVAPQGQFMIFSERAFKRLKQMKDLLAGGSSSVSSELAAALDSCLGPMCETAPILQDLAPVADLTKMAADLAKAKVPALVLPPPPVKKDVEVPPADMWIKEIGRENHPSEILAGAKKWHDLQVSQGKITVDKRLGSPTSKNFANAIFNQLWDYILVDWDKPKFEFSLTTASNAMYAVSPKPVRDIKNAWINFYDTWERALAEQIDSENQEAVRNHVAEVERLKAQHEAALAEAEASVTQTENERLAAAQAEADRAAAAQAEADRQAAAQAEADRQAAAQAEADRQAAAQAEADRQAAAQAEAERQAAAQAEAERQAAAQAEAERQAAAQAEAERQAAAQAEAERQAAAQAEVDRQAAAQAEADRRAAAQAEADRRAAAQAEADRQAAAQAEADRQAAARAEAERKAAAAAQAEAERAAAAAEVERLEASKKAKANQVAAERAAAENAAAADRAEAEEAANKRADRTRASEEARLAQQTRVAEALSKMAQNRSAGVRSPLSTPSAKKNAAAPSGTKSMETVPAKEDAEAPRKVLSLPTSAQAASSESTIAEPAPAEPTSARAEPAEDFASMLNPAMGKVEPGPQKFRFETSKRATVQPLIDYYLDNGPTPLVAGPVRKQMIEFIQATLGIEADIQAVDFLDVMERLFQVVAWEVPFERYKLAVNSLNELDWQNQRGMSVAEAVWKSQGRQDDLRHAWSALNMLLKLEDLDSYPTLDQINASIQKFETLVAKIESHVIRDRSPRPLQIPPAVIGDAAAKFDIPAEKWTAALEHWHGFVIPGSNFSNGHEWTVLFLPQDTNSLVAAGQAFLALVNGDKVTAINATEDIVFGRFYRTIAEDLELRETDVPVQFPIRDIRKVKMRIEGWKQVQMQFLRDLSPAFIFGLLRRAKSAEMKNDTTVQIVDPLTLTKWLLTISPTEARDTFLVKNVFPLVRATPAPTQNAQGSVRN